MKRRCVCRLPENLHFAPDGKSCADTVVMTVDEYEVIRLIDFENGTQEQCSEQMKIARTTVQGIYDSARKKLADVLVNGKRLTIQGGEYELCEKFCNGCGYGCGGCGRKLKAKSE
jgi:predicted DNA-binding protein (UPF0251 family)